MSTASERAGGVQVIARAAAVLNALRDGPGPLTLSQLARRSALPRSTVHRLVGALEEQGFVVAASAQGGYRLGPTLASFAASARRGLVEAVHPFLQALCEELDETVDLAVLEHDRVVFVDQVAPTRRLRAVSAVGAAFPAYCTANGKALLARLDDDDVRRLLPERLEPLTPSTLTSREALVDELAEVRRTSLAYDREEHTAGICAIGTALELEGLVAAVTVPLPAQRFYGNEDDLAATLLQARARIAATTGGV